MEAKEDDEARGVTGEEARMSSSSGCLTASLDLQATPQVESNPCATEGGQVNQELRC